MQRNRTRIGTRLVCACILGVVLLAGCAPAYRYSHSECRTFTDENVAQLRVGMSHAEVIALFGDPDEQYVSEYGADVGEPWTGRALIYFTNVDKDLEYAKRYRKNLLVFFPSEGEMTLNHWELE